MFSAQLCEPKAADGSPAPSGWRAPLHVCGIQPVIKGVYSFKGGTFWKVGKKKNFPKDLAGITDQEQGGGLIAVMQQRQTRTTYSCWVKLLIKHADCNFSEIKEDVIYRRTRW